MFTRIGLNKIQKRRVYKNHILSLERESFKDQRKKEK